MSDIHLSYIDLKIIIARKNLAWQYSERPDRYKIFAVDNDIYYRALIHKSPITLGGLDASVEQANQNDFESNYKSIANYAAGSRQYPFSTPDFMFNGDGILATATKNTTTSIDFKIPGTLGTFRYINGAVVITNKAVFGDWSSSSIVDIDNLLGYGAGTVLASYVTKWYINPSNEMNIETPYAGKIPAGMYIRIIYHSVGTTDDVGVAINYRLHAPL